MTTPKVWTPDEEQRLREYLAEKPRPQYATIAERMKRTTDSIRNKVFSLRKEGRHDWLQEERIGFFDIETTHLKASIGNVISWAIKPLDGPVKFVAWNRKEAIDWKKMDRRVMKELVKELQDYDLLVTYYGTRFDMTFIRTRALMLDIPGFPQFGTLKHWDAYYSVRSKLCLHSNRLSVATETFGIHGKTPLPVSVWGRGRLGYPDAIKDIKEHNVGDVEILEELYKLMLPYVQITRKSI